MGSLADIGGCGLRTHSVMRHQIQTSTCSSPVPKTHRVQALIEIQPGAVSDIALQGLVNDWIAPMIVDNIIAAMLGTSTTADRLQCTDYCEHNNPRRTAHDEEEPNGRSATETSPAETNAETSIITDHGRAQGAERVRRSAEHDGQ